MRVMHIASFDGNIGDSINHNGFWNSFSKYICANALIDKIEMREFYQSWGIRRFDDGFAEKANQYDLVVFGGGNFFDMIWPDSSSGVTIDMRLEVLDQIKAPILFNGLGADIGNPINEVAVNKFNAFLDRCLSRNKTIVSVRNDGSYEIIRALFGDPYASKIVEIPDGGFFNRTDDYFHPEIPEGKKIVTINVAHDKEQVRWPDADFTYNDFCMCFASFINKQCTVSEDYHFVFVPHIPSDIDVISVILGMVNDRFRRTRITMAPYVNGTVTTADYIADLYKKATLNIGMRYHSNITSISNLVPTIGIVTFKKHRELYRKIGLEKRLVDVTKPGFDDALIERVKSINMDPHIYIDENRKLMDRLDADNARYFEQIKGIVQ